MSYVSKDVVYTYVYGSITRNTVAGVGGRLHFLNNEGTHKDEIISEYYICTDVVLAWSNIP